MRSLEHVFGDTAHAAALELGVVLDADPGEHGDFFASQPRHAAAPAVGVEPGLVGSDASSAGGQELADVGPASHSVQATSTTSS